MYAPPTFSSHSGWKRGYSIAHACYYQVICGLFDCIEVIYQPFPCVASAESYGRYLTSRSRGRTPYTNLELALPSSLAVGGLLTGHLPACNSTAGDIISVIREADSVLCRNYVEAMSNSQHPPDDSCANGGSTQKTAPCGSGRQEACTPAVTPRALVQTPTLDVSALTARQGSGPACSSGESAIYTLALAPSPGHTNFGMQVASRVAASFSVPSLEASTSKHAGGAWTECRRGLSNVEEQGSRCMGKEV